MDSSLSVLYVDDNPALLEVGKIYLERNGFCHVKTAKSGLDALGLMDEEPFDAVISDYQMPGMDGLEFLIEVRSTYGDIPFVIFTGRGREEVFIKAIENGVDFYVQKGGDPGVQFAELIHKVMYAVSKRRAGDFIESEDEAHMILLEELNEPAFIVGKSPESPLIANKSFLSLLELSNPVFPDLSPYRIGIDDITLKEMFVSSLDQKNGSYFDMTLIKPGGKKLGVWLRIRKTVLRGEMALFVKIEKIYDGKGNGQLPGDSDDGELSQIIENANSIIIKWTPDGKLTFFNPFAERFFGYSKSEIIGKNIVGTIVSEKDCRGRDLRDLMTRIAGDPGSFTNNENENITRDGSRVRVIWTNSGIFDKKGNLLEIASVGIEIKDGFDLNNKTVL